MITITLADGAKREFDGPLTGLELAESIAKSLAKKALAVKINGKMADLSELIDTDAEIAIITPEMEEGLELIRHDAAHVMAEAVQDLYPGTQVTIGPVIENGFYYDFAREEPFHPEDLEKIENRMHEIIARNDPIVKEVWDRERAIKYFEDKGEAYKARIIRDLPEGEPISVYRQGQWLDLCRGPHAPSTGKIGKAFKVLKLAGAYWRGDSNNEMLQRIYATCFAHEKDLKAYLYQLEEAEKRDHRKLGREMNLFHFEETAPGAVFWHPKGWTLFLTLINYMRRRQQKAGYVEIATPTVMDRRLWEISGHWENYREHMYTTETEDGRQFALKPMNCPGGVLVFKQGITSYRDLPRRIAEFGKVNRYEPSGALHGLLRVREFTQDDAHIFCTPENMQRECRDVIEMVMDIYAHFGFENIHIKFSDRPESRIGADAVWDQLEAALTGALKEIGLDYSLNPGDGAFYGPKLEFVLRDTIGRDWQCGTLQVDMFLPERFDIHYIGEDGEKHRPVMLHRALFGSLERFIGILIEHYAGHFPLWLSPLQAVVATITSHADDYARKVEKQMRTSGLLVETDLRNEKINYKIREHSLSKIPVIVVVGRNEANDGTVSIRRLGSRDQQIMPLDQMIAKLTAEATAPDLR